MNDFMAVEDSVVRGKCDSAFVLCQATDKQPRRPRREFLARETRCPCFMRFDPADFSGMAWHDDCYRARDALRGAWLAKIVIAACAAGKEHLWRDLGLANRRELSRLLTDAFPAFARKNTGDMKWEKFLYRACCAGEGIYVCPAPSCRECADYADCFAPER